MHILYLDDSGSPINPQEDVVNHAFEEISSRFEKYLQRISEETSTQQRGILVLDKSSYAV